MTYSAYLLLALATLPASALREPIRNILERHAEPITTEYRKAYSYLQTRTRWTQYGEYARVKLPLGSGIVEDTCKTIYTRRLKLSGMRRTKVW